MKLCEKYHFQIVGLEWERIFLHLKVQTDYEGAIRFVIVKDQNGKENVETESIVLSQVQKKDDIYEIIINMAAAHGRSFLENGVWKLGAGISEGFCKIGIKSSLGYELDSQSRIFPYGDQKYSYNVFFSLESCQEQMELRIHSYFMQVNPKWKKKRYVADAVTWKEKLKGICKWAAFQVIGRTYDVMEHFYPKNGKKILFMSETRDRLWGNLKYIEERMKERGMEQEYEFGYSFRKVLSQKYGLKSWLHTLSCIAKSDYIFIDDYAPVFGYLKLSDRTRLIQVWHAGEGFKSVGYSRFGKEGSPEPVQSCHKTYDYVTVGSEKLVHVYEEVFGIEKEAFLPTGMARLDDFLNEEKRKSFQDDFYTQYPEMRGKNVILFAPTFRGKGQKEAYYDYEQLDLRRIYEFCKDESVFLIKMHPFVKEKIQIPECWQDRIFDLTQYPNINDLYYITDLMITDYSSNYYEYALLKKPVLFYTYDREEYELLRGVHRSVKEHAPGKVCDSFEELMTALETKDYEFEKIEQFVKDNFEGYDGHACDRIIDRIIYGKQCISYPQESEIS